MKNCVLLSFICLYLMINNQIADGLKTKDKVKILEEKMQLLEEKVQELEFTSAFTATAFESQSLNKGSVIKFQKPIVNINGDYKLWSNKHNTSSVYVCPKKGIYYFTFTINSYAMEKNSQRNFKARAQAGLFVNGIRIVDVLTYNDNIAYIITSSTNIAIVYCEQGWPVQVKADFDENRIWSFYAYGRTSFSGYYMKTATGPGVPPLSDPGQQDGLEEADGSI